MISAFTLVFAYLLLNLVCLLDTVVKLPRFSASAYLSSSGDNGTSEKYLEWQ